MRMMHRLALAAAGGFAASPALAAGDYPFFSLHNTDLVVAISFLLFVGVLVYFKVPGLLGGMLDKRAEKIKADLDEAKSLRDEAKALLDSYERRQREVQEQADRIVAAAREDAMAAADQARADLQTTIARRLQAAEDRIASAEAAAVREVRDQAVKVAVAAAGDLLAKQMTAENASALIETSIEEVGQRLH
ncbi:MAG: F0F1 ATP synthase subunit B [Gemmobacter sp.]